MEEKKIGKRRHDEENSLPLKHYKYSTCLDRDHRYVQILHPQLHSASGSNVHHGRRELRYPDTGIIIMH